MVLAVVALQSLFKEEAPSSAAPRAVASPAVAPENLEADAVCDDLEELVVRAQTGQATEAQAIAELGELVGRGINTDYLRPVVAEVGAAGVNSSLEQLRPALQALVDRCDQMPGR